MFHRFSPAERILISLWVPRLAQMNDVGGPTPPPHVLTSLSSPVLPFVSQADPAPRQPAIIGKHSPSRVRPKLSPPSCEGVLSGRSCPLLFQVNSPVGSCQVSDRSCQVTTSRGAGGGTPMIFVCPTEVFLSRFPQLSLGFCFAKSFFTKFLIDLIRFLLHACFTKMYFEWLLILLSHRVTVFLLVRRYITRSCLTFSLCCTSWNAPQSWRCFFMYITATSCVFCLYR